MNGLVARLTLVAVAALAGDGDLPPGAGSIVAQALEGRSFDVLAELTDKVGSRLAGSPGAAAAVRWSSDWLRAAALEVRLEPVKVKAWVRGEERAEILASDLWRAQPLAVAALGSSPPTPPGGVTASVIEVSSLEELRSLGDKVRGRVVLFQHQMKDAAGYGRNVKLRSRGPAEAARAGAAAALVRSLATASLRTPHTGITDFAEGGAAIPAAAVSVEDAELIHRLLALGPVRVKLVLGCGPANPPEVASANVVAEWRGREIPDEVVLIGAHLDSWDLGTGAQDDGAGVAMVMEAMRILRSRGVAPRRTLRAVLFMDEETGAIGGRAYHDAHRADPARLVAALEADSGGGRPTGVKVSAGPGATEIVKGWAQPLASVGVDSVVAGGGGADVDPWVADGVPLLMIAQDVSHYFDWHHSAADTLDKVERSDLARATAAVAWMAWAAADARETLPRSPAPR
ncbi:MAG TPA: M20/M25/M40 family metallo-hydrolase [Anaeromyxobacteraceae bacterium]|nr:M20/M25/M40 family metallo-hydrolase [Anaeromyxobacteraceae bacterium]